MEGGECDIRDDMSCGNLYDQLHRPAKEEESTYDVLSHSKEEQQVVRQPQGRENPNSAVQGHAVMKLDSIRKSQNYWSEKSTKTAIALLAAFVLGCFIMSMVGMVILLKFQKKTNEAQQNLRAEIREIKGSYEKQKSEMMKVQAQDLELNGSVALLNDQIVIFNRSMTSLNAQLVIVNGSLAFLQEQISNAIGTVSSNIERLHSLIKETKMESASSLVSLQSINNTIQHHSLEIKEMNQRILEVRLVGGNQSSGRVEIFHNGEWGTICDDRWDVKDATVVCRMLGYESASSAPTNSAYGNGTGKIWLDDVGCGWTKSTIHECSKSDWGSHNCKHNEDASAVCK